VITFFTIGHSNHTAGRFLELLKAHGVNTLVDVRSFPGSRKWPHFNQDNLRGWLAESNIEYVWMPSLGGRRRPNKQSKNTAWRNTGFRGYADYMESAAFREGIEQLLGIARRSTTAIMCAESLWWQCHRSLISDYLKVAGHRVLHIRSDEAIQEHPFTSPARVVAGSLTYEPPQQELNFNT
jgi:uncharacterized protein (DUF488 family)